MPETEVDTFAGIDVSARELSVALRRGKGEDKPAMAKFSNHPSGHQALIAHLLRGGSRHLRRALYMPALVALRRDPYLRRFYQNLLARGKARLQAVVAVMRKLLHALFAMFRTNQPYDGSKLCCAVDMAGNAIAACA